MKQKTNLVSPSKLRQFSRRIPSFQRRVYQLVLSFPRVRSVEPTSSAPIPAVDRSAKPSGGKRKYDQWWVEEIFETNIHDDTICEYVPGTHEHQSTCISGRYDQRNLPVHLPVQPYLVELDPVAVVTQSSL